jgi:hypothetical protein
VDIVENDTLENIWMEAVLSNLKVCICVEELRENHEKPVRITHRRSITSKTSKV